MNEGLLLAWVFLGLFGTLLMHVYSLGELRVKPKPTFKLIRFYLIGVALGPLALGLFLTLFVCADVREDLFQRLNAAHQELLKERTIKGG